MIDAEAMRASLHQDLRDHTEYITIGDTEYMCLRHPMLYEIPLLNPEWANKMYEMRVKRIAEYEESGDIQGILMFYERPYRAMTLLDLCGRLEIDDRKFWDAVRFVWMDTENMWETNEQFKALLELRTDSKHLIMTREEFNYLRFAPRKITIYRGIHGGNNPDGMSWTTERMVAEKFAFRRGDIEDNSVETATVDKDDIFAYINGRGEHEVILLDPHRRETVSVEKVSAEY